MHKILRLAGGQITMAPSAMKMTSKNHQKKSLCVLYQGAQICAFPTQNSTKVPLWNTLSPYLENSFPTAWMYTHCTCAGREVARGLTNQSSTVVMSVKCSANSPTTQAAANRTWKMNQNRKNIQLIRIIHGPGKQWNLGDSVTIIQYFFLYIDVGI